MKPQFVWNTYGDWMLTLIDTNLWDLTGSWVGWLDGDQVYTTDGEWVGKLSRDSRIIRKRAASHPPLRTDVPSRPPKPDLPGRCPLPPSFAELTFSEIDVLDEDPEVFKRLSDKRPDMGEK
jgi:hypothetical protein